MKVDADGMVMVEVDGVLERRPAEVTFHQHWLGATRAFSCRRIIPKVRPGELIFETIGGDPRIVSTPPRGRPKV